MHILVKNSFFDYVTIEKTKGHGDVLHLLTPYSPILLSCFSLFLSVSSSKALASRGHFFVLFIFFFLSLDFMHCGIAWLWTMLVLGWVTASVHYSCLCWLCACVSRPKPLSALFPHFSAVIRLILFSNGCLYILKKVSLEQI